MHLPEIPAFSSPFLLVRHYYSCAGPAILKQRELPVKLRLAEPRGVERTVAAPAVEAEPFARDVEALAQQFREFAAAAHAAAETGIVVAPAAHLVHAAHHVLRFQRIVRLEPMPEQILDLMRQPHQDVTGA